MAALLPQAVWAQSALEAEPEVANVGEVLYQNRRTLTYKLRNIGDSPVSITTVLPSCECTDVHWPQTPIGAGETAELTATFFARTLGSFQKEIEVYTDRDAEPLYLTFQGRVVADASDYGGTFPVDMGSVRLSTATVEFDDVNRGDHPEVHIMVLNNSRTTLRPQLMHLPSYLSATYYPEQLAAGRVGRITLSLNSERLLTYGLTQTNIYMARYMGDKVSADNEIDVSAVLLPRLPKQSPEELARAPQFVVETDTLDFAEQLRKARGKVKKTITIGNAGQSPLTVYSVQVYGNALTVSVGKKKIAPATSTKLTVTLDAAKLRRQKTEPRVLIITDDPRRPKTTLVIKKD